MPSILRETNKAYVGYSSYNQEPQPAVATGNWGCGAFRGNTNLKFLIQLMACAAVKRDMVYYTFGDSSIKDNLFSLYNFMCDKEITCRK